MGMFKQFTHVSITVTDIGKAREFYSDTLGFAEIDRPAFNLPRGSGTAWAATCSSTSS
jgi:catechol 2,3-dioxygenase-like lactoylglutathione lyase family enzyme